MSEHLCLFIFPIEGIKSWLLLYEVLLSIDDVETLNRSCEFLTSEVVDTLNFLVSVLNVLDAAIDSWVSLCSEVVETEVVEDTPVTADVTIFLASNAEFAVFTNLNLYDVVVETSSVSVLVEYAFNAFFILLL